MDESLSFWSKILPKTQGKGEDGRYKSLLSNQFVHIEFWNERLYLNARIDVDRMPRAIKTSHK